MGDNKHAVTVTAIIVRDGKYLITQRSKDKKNFPGMWTVPGGNLEVEDYINLPKDTAHHWYNIFEKVLKREVVEEVGLERLRQIRQAVTLPLVAIGGISKDNMAQVLAAGADSVAVIGAVLGAEDVEEAAKQLVDRLEVEK